jgi:hypothetical protein
VRFWPKRSRPVAEPAPRPNPTRVAVLEYDLLGVQPESGSFAAAVINIRRAGSCVEHQAVDAGALADGPGVVILCTGCGNHITPTEEGGWRIVTAP